MAACLLDWAAVAALTGEDVTGEIQDLRYPSGPVLHQIDVFPLLEGQEGELAAVQFTTALLVQATNAGSRR